MCILKTHLLTEKKSHVLLFSSDLALDAETMIDYYRLRFQIEFNFRDAKQHWGLEDFMNVNKTPVNLTGERSAIKLYGTTSQRRLINPATADKSFITLCRNSTVCKPVNVGSGDKSLIKLLLHLISSRSVANSSPVKFLIFASWAIKWVNFAMSACVIVARRALPMHQVKSHRSKSDNKHRDRWSPVFS